ncbi:MAG: flotillin domain-containing protein [Rhizobiaceae bacterium]
MTEFITFLIIAIVIVAIVVVLAAYFYRRSTREVSLIRTGVGGRKVVMDGGVLSIPYFHDVSSVNMQTLRLEVKRTSEQALITKDRLRVDVGVEFYVSVDPTEEAIARASQTLGDRTFHPEKLRELIDGKLVDALRSVAAKMTMDELHENRADFVNQVAEYLSEPLSRNGLALESVSLSALDQTPFSALDENNAFNAVGMRKLAEVISKSKKERAEIETDTEVAVHRSAMESSKRRLEIDLEEQQAQIKQTQELETLRAAQLADIAASKAQSEVRTNEARIQMEQEIRTTDIAREKAIREAEIQQAQELEVAEQERSIIVAKKTEAQSKALAAADLAKAEAVAAAETIATARANAEAQRKREIALLNAKQDSEVSAEKLISQAKAEAEASVEQAKATLQQAKSTAEASKLRIATMKDEMETKAKGQKSLNEAENALNKEMIALKADLAKLEALPKIVEQMVKPAEKIDSIKIHHIGGNAAGSGTTGPKPPVNQALDSIMEMAVQLPALKKIGEELGISVEDGMSGLSSKDADKAK